MYYIVLYNGSENLHVCAVRETLMCNQHLECYILRAVSPIPLGDHPISCVLLTTSFLHHVHQALCSEREWLLSLDANGKMDV